MNNQVCPFCGYNSTGQEAIFEEEQQPSKGDISFCINCGEISEFTSNGLKKIDKGSLSVESQAQLKEIEDAWVRTRAIIKLENGKKKRN